MKFSSYNAGLEMNIEKGNINILVIESHKLFDDIIISLNEQMEGETQAFLLLEEDKEIELKKRCELFCSPLDIEYSKRQTQKKLISELCGELALQGYDEKIAESYGSIIDLMGKLQLCSDYNIDFDEQKSVIDLLKYLDVHIKSPEGRLCEKIMEYGSTVHRLIGKDIFILANCDAYMLESDYEHLRKWINYEDIYLFVIENHQLDLDIDTKSYIVDNDLCEIH